MDKKYIVSVQDNHILTVSKPTSKTLVYRVPYQNLKDCIVDNRFIVYILVEEKMDEKDLIYVGKSKNSTSTRPTSHTDKANWTYCYILTTIVDNTFLNDGVYQYVENKICEKINECEKFQNTTLQTNVNTTNSFEEIFCRDFLEETIEMLEILGLTFEKSNQEKMREENTETQIKQKRKVQNITEKPNTYTIGNITYPFVSWKESLVNHCEKIIQEKGFETFKKKVLNLKFSERKSKRKIFGQTREEMRGFSFHKFEEGELYLLTNYSAAMIIQINEMLNEMFPEEKLEYVF